LIKKAGILLLVLNLLQTALYAQNLLPNGSFEQLDITGCSAPEESFVRASDWYTIQGTPDLFTATCPIPEIAEVFWSENASSYDGLNFMGLKCRVNSNQSYLSEGIASKLKKNLVPEQAYFISMKIRNKGIYQGFPASVITCPLKPSKQIEIYTHDDSIKVVNDFSNGSAKSNGDLVAAINSPVLQSDKVSTEWSIVATCFIANANVSNISMIMPLGNFGDFPECSDNDTKGTFFSYYFDIDDVILDKLPKDTLLTRYFEEGSIFEISIPQELDLPFLTEATIIWADGYEGSRRTLDEAGIYELDIILDCGIIQATLNLIAREKEFPFFIPNVFSPNEDGFNDYLEIFIPNDKVVNEFNLQIFDRWGNRVFISNDYNVFWNGTIGNRPASGQYIYYLECTITDETGKQDYSKTDMFTIIR
jgi:gliding motility-associated-like protein